VPRPLQHPTGVHTGQALISRVAPQSAMIPSRSHSRARRALAYGLGTSLHEGLFIAGIPHAVERASPSYMKVIGLGPLPR
jgi:hypothetical protein